MVSIEKVLEIINLCITKNVSFYYSSETKQIMFMNESGIDAIFKAEMDHNNSKIFDLEDSVIDKILKWLKSL